MLEFGDYQPLTNAIIFSFAAGIVWLAGTKLEQLADAIAVRTGMGHAFTGMLLLAGATSLPEITTTITALSIGSYSMAVHNLLGSVVFNTFALATADAISDRSALTHRSPSYALILAGAGVIFLLALVLMAGVMAQATSQASGWFVRGRSWELLIIMAYLALLYTMHRGQDAPRWRPSSTQNPQGSEEDSCTGEASNWGEWSSAQLYFSFAVASLLVLAAAWVLAQSGNALAEQTGLSGGFVGFALIGFATSLPEISTTATAARNHRNNMAIANVFGSSAFVLLLLAIAGLVFGIDVMQHVASPSGLFALGLGIAVTFAYLWGLLEHEDRTFLRMGWDSVAVIAFVLGGSWVMHTLE